MNPAHIVCNRLPVSGGKLAVNRVLRSSIEHIPTAGGFPLRSHAFFLADECRKSTMHCSNLEWRYSFLAKSCWLAHAESKTVSSQPLS